jgi:glycine oxidase
VVGATEESVGFDARVTGEGLRRVVELGERLVPAVGDCTFRSAWAGLRPTSPDGLPIVGPIDGVEGLAVATGHHRNGVLLSPVTGALISDWVSGKGIPDDAEAFRPGRFA